MIIRTCCAITAAALLARPAGAAAESAPPEPIAFEEIMPSEPGELTGRFSLEERRFTADGGEAGSSVYSVPEMQLFFGLADRFSCDLSLPFLTRREEGGATRTGPGDIGLGVKYLLLREGRLPALTAAAAVELPTGRSRYGLGEGATGTELSLGWLKSLGAATVQGLAGYAFSGGGGEKSVLYGFSAAFPLAPSWRLFVELTGERDLKDNSDRVAAGPGLKYGVSQDTFLAAGFLAGLGKRAGDRRVITQLQFAF